MLGELERAAGRGGWQRRDPSCTGSRSSATRRRRLTARGRGGSADITLPSTSPSPMARSSGATPSFLGANPAVVPSGPRAGRALTGEEEFAREPALEHVRRSGLRRVVDPGAAGHPERRRAPGVDDGIPAASRAGPQRLRRPTSSVDPALRRSHAAGRSPRRMGARPGRRGLTTSPSPGPAPEEPGPRPLLRRPWPALPDRVRQHAERGQPHPRRVARPGQRLGRGPAARASAAAHAPRRLGCRR